MNLSPGPPLLLLMVALLAPAVAAGDYDKDTLAGMDAEVQQDWVGAAEAFARAADAGQGDLRSSLRLRYARERGMAFFKAQFEVLLKEKRFDEAARAVAVASLIDPRDSVVTRARRQVEHAGATVPTLPADEPTCAVFPRRTLAGRLRSWSTLGAPFGQAEKLIDNGVKFLLATQEKNGGWDSKKYGGSGYDAGVTALALLALLVDGPGGLAGERGAAARKAATFLVDSQAEDGSFGEMYGTALAIEALAEYAAIAGDLERLRPTLERARDYLLDAQNPGAGWRYKPREGKSDTSVTSRAVCALHRLTLAGVDVPKQAFRDALAWVDSMTEPNFGQVGYNFPGGAPARPEGKQDLFPPEHTASMTAAGALVVIYEPDETRDALSRMISLIIETLPLKRFPDMYYWHAGASALVEDYGTIEPPWYAALVDAAAPCAKEDGGMAACDAWGSFGGRIYATAMTVLALAAPFSEPGPPGGNAAWASSFLEKGWADRYHMADKMESETGIYVDPTISLVMTVTGTIKPWLGSPSAGWNGIEKVSRSHRPLLKGEPFACLLGRVGPEGKLFAIEGGKPITFKTPGHLYVLSNDEEPGDGKGYWEIHIRVVDK